MINSLLKESLILSHVSNLKKSHDNLYCNPISAFHIASYSILFYSIHPSDLIKKKITTCDTIQSLLISTN